MAREQLRHQARHRDPVLEHVGDPRRRADVVLEHPPAPVAVADQITAGDVAVDAAGGADAVHRPRELGRLTISDHGTMPAWTISCPW